MHSHCQLACQMLAAAKHHSVGCNRVRNIIMTLNAAQHCLTAASWTSSNSQPSNWVLNCSRRVQLHQLPHKYTQCKMAHRLHTNKRLDSAYACSCHCKTLHDMPATCPACFTTVTKSLGFKLLRRPPPCTLHKTWLLSLSAGVCKFVSSMMHRK